MRMLLNRAIFTKLIHLFWLISANAYVIIDKLKYYTREEVFS